jgi:CRP-like cAMP-binding protein
MTASLSGWLLSERGATLAVTTKQLRSIPTFSFLSEADAALLISECFQELEFSRGEVLFSQVRLRGSECGCERSPHGLTAAVAAAVWQGELHAAMYFLVEGELLFSHTPPRSAVDSRPSTFVDDFGRERELFEVPPLAAGFEVVESPLARHKRFGAGDFAAVATHDNPATVQCVMVPTDRYRAFGEPFLTCSKRSDVTVTVKSDAPVKVLMLKRQLLLDYLISSMVRHDRW